MPERYLEIHMWLKLVLKRRRKLLLKKWELKVKQKFQKILKILLKMERPLLNIH